MTLSVVIPLYNEERSAAETFRKITAYLSLQKMNWEICAVDDGSKDRTAQVMRDYLQANPKAPIRVLSFHPNHGKGFAVRQGVIAAKGDRVLITDADMSTPIKEIDKLLKAIQGGADIAIGSRALRAPGCDVQQSLKRHVSGRIFNLIVQSVLLPGLKDTQCGFKCLTREAAAAVFSRQRLDGFSFDAEILYLARKQGLKITEVPVMWSQGPDSRVSMLRDSIRMTKDLFKIKKIHS